MLVKLDRAELLERVARRQRNQDQPTFSADFSEQLRQNEELRRSLLEQAREAGIYVEDRLAVGDC